MNVGDYVIFVLAPVNSNTTHCVVSLIHVADIVHKSGSLSQLYFSGRHNALGDNCA